ncbi:MAG: ABATE domain-containing protein [Anaerolineales bacterium]|jgi:predicted RNA-binding Zn ribbon-like protein
MKQAEAPMRVFKRVGGDICLDFVNTVDWHASDAPQELLADYEHLVDWSRQAGTVDEVGAGRLLRQAAAHPAIAEKTYHRAIAIRETLYRIMVATIEGQIPEPSDLQEFNTSLTDAIRRLRIMPAEGRLAWEWAGEGAELESVLWPILRSAADLLTSERRNRLGQCADDRGCGWLFIDKSKNQSRRWCDMSDCGNRAKARSHYQRKRRRRA